MKTITCLLLTTSFICCNKTDKINHYITKKITAKELIENGFYKYSYTDTIDDEDQVNDTIKHIIKYDMYSNVKPEKNEDGEICPMQLVKLGNLDSAQQNKRINYRKKVLNDRIITCVFRNDSLFYKNIVVYSFNRSQNKIADFTSKEKIIKYYDSLKIPIKQIINNNSINEEYPKRFLIDNYKTFIDYSDKGFYEISINYVNNFTYRDILEDWYAGHVNKVRYFL